MPSTPTSCRPPTSGPPGPAQVSKWLPAAPRALSMCPAEARIVRPAGGAPAHRFRRMPPGVLLVAPLTLFLAVFFVWPLVDVLRMSFYSRFPGEATLTVLKYTRIFGDPFYRGVAANSLTMAVAVTVLTALLGYPAAYYLVRFR